MKMNTIKSQRPFIMAEWASLKDRAELSLIFMVAAAAGESAMASRGMAGVGGVLASFVNGIAFSILWVLPSLHPRNVVRTLVKAIAWVFLSSGIAHQVANLLTSSAFLHEVSSR